MYTFQRQTEIRHLLMSARIIRRIFVEVLPMIVQGTTTSSIDTFIKHCLRNSGATSVLTSQFGFPATACISVNEVAAHGVPGSLTLRNGDVITIDVSVDRAGWSGDAAWSYVVGHENMESKTLVEAAWAVSRAGVIAAKAGKRIGDIAAAIRAEAFQKEINLFACFAGHGIGRKVHEDPIIAYTIAAGEGALLVPGMVLNIEPIVTFGRTDIEKQADGWSYIAQDRSWSAQFEHTVAIHEDKSTVLTSDNIITELLPESPIL